MEFRLNIISIAVCRKPKRANTLDLSQYLKSTDVLPPPHDYAIVVQQAAMDGSSPPYPTGFSKLNAGGYFIKGLVSEEIDAETGLTNTTIVYYVDITEPAVEDVTLENAYDKMKQFRRQYAEAIEMIELENWINDYISENFIETYTTYYDSSDFAYDWVSDHKVAYRHPYFKQ